MLAAVAVVSIGAHAQRHDTPGNDVVAQNSKTAGGVSSRATSATMPEAQMQGSDQAKASAEARHDTKTHGASASANQPEAQMQGSDKAKAAAERKHKAKTHGTRSSAKQREAQQEPRESN